MSTEISFVMAAVSGLLAIVSVLMSLRSYERLRSQRRRYEALVTTGRKQLREAIEDEDLSPEERSRLRLELSELNLLVHMGSSSDGSRRVVEFNPVDEKSIGHFVDEIEEIETRSRGHRGSAAPVG